VTGQPVPAAHADDAWWSSLRRAFGVPVLVTDEGAKVSIGLEPMSPHHCCRFRRRLFIADRLERWII
jgi:hypothetical protein